MKDTQLRILDVAEGLFVQHGFSDTTLRKIAGVARVNLAAAHYHFGSKDELLKAVIVRRVAPINQQRLALLEKHESRAGTNGLSVEDIVHALLDPIRVLLDSDSNGRTFVQMISRLYFERETFFIQMARTEFANVLQRFQAALQLALPELSPREVAWRMQLASGTIAHAMRSSGRFHLFTTAACKPSDIDGEMTSLIEFVAGGFRAPVVKR